MENLNIVQVYTDEEELKDIFNYLNTLEIEYRKEYKGMYGRMMSVLIKLMIHLILIIILF